TLSQSPMLGFHKQMDNRIKLLEEILSFRMQGVEFDNGDMRSEERFSRNAETDLVCRLLLEKKKPYPQVQLPGARDVAEALRRHVHLASAGRGGDLPRPV